jgi:pimeloyl-ACP methyl ester carboxylesterase
MVFWPSLLMNGSIWQEYVAHFSKTRRVVVVDPPGHGTSEALTHTFSFDECVSCLVDVLDGLGIETAGHGRHPGCVSKPRGQGVWLSTACSWWPMSSAPLSPTA